MVYCWEMYVADEKSVLPLYGCVFVDLPVIVYIHTHTHIILIKFSILL